MFDPFSYLQLGIPHTFVMMSYQYKFQDDDQTKIKGSVKYVLRQQQLFWRIFSLWTLGDLWRIVLIRKQPKTPPVIVLFILDLCEEEVTLLFSGLRSGFFGTVVEYGAERKISRHSILGATVSVGVPQGVSLKIK